jgi:hypothetical protein
MIAAQSPALTNAIAAINAATANGDESLQLIAAKCRALMVGYDSLYRHEPYVPFEVEQTAVVSLTNPETGRCSKTFNLGGKLDIGYTKHSKRGVMDHKSTSCDIAEEDSPYLRQLVVEAQVSQYMLLKWQLGDKLDEATWDIMRKPTISPKKLTKAEVHAVVAHQEYFGKRLSMSSIASAAEDARETLEMYEARLARDCSVERPKFYFRRHSVPRLDNELFNYAMDVWQISQDIIHCRASTKKTNRFPPASSSACMAYNTPCKFLGICSGYDTPDSPNWVRKDNVHAELPDIEGDGRDLLTNSRIRCFQACQRKHYFVYELGIERVRDSDSEALVFGTVWHAALEAWWKTLLPKEDERVDSSETTTATTTTEETFSF